MSDLKHRMHVILNPWCIPRILAPENVWKGLNMSESSVVSDGPDLSLALSPRRVDR